MADFYTLLTEIGQAKFANAGALDETVKLKTLAVGDGGGNVPTPDSSATALVHENRRAQLNSVDIDDENANWIVCEQVIPENVGGWWIREVGIYDDKDDLIAYGNFPETYKPELGEGSGRTQTIRVVLMVASVDNVELKIDPAVVLATREYVDAATAQATEVERGTAKLASETQAKAGANSTNIMTPERVRQWGEENAELLVTGDKTVTVGDGGDYATINAALEDLSKLSPVFKPDGIQVEVKLLAGFAMEEQVIVRNGLDLGWITITGEDSETDIVRSKLTDEVKTGTYPAFAAYRNSVLPIIDVLFVMDASGDDNGRDGVSVAYNSRATILDGAGVKNAGRIGLDLSGSSVVIAQGAIFTGAGNSGLSVIRASIADVRRIDVSGAMVHGITVSSGSTVNADEAVASNAGDNGINCTSGSKIRAYNIDCSHAGGNGVYATHASRVSAEDADLSYAGENGIYAHHKSSIDALRVDCSHAANYAVYARHASVIDADTATLSHAGGSAAAFVYGASVVELGNSDLSNATGSSIYVENGGIANASRANCQNAGQGGSGNALTAKSGGMINAFGADCREPADKAASCSSGGQISCVAIDYSPGKKTDPSPNNITGGGNMIRTDI